MDRRRIVRESERAAIERWFPAGPLGPLFDPGTGDLLPAPAAAIPGWQAEAFARIDHYVEHEHVAAQVHGWLFGLFIAGLLAIAMAAGLPIGPTLVIGGAAGGALLHGWPIWQLYRFRRDLRRLRERIRGELATRVPIPRELAARFRRRNPWRIALHAWVWGLAALGIGAQHFVAPQDVPAAIVPVALAAVGIAWILHFLSRRIDLRRGWHWHRGACALSPGLETSGGLPVAEYDYDLFVIGAGSGGVRASRVSAAHGARVAVAEEYRIGGTCVIRGCVPKKLLVYGAHFAEDLKDARRFGWNVPECDFDWAVLRDNVLADVDRLNGLYTQTLHNNQVETFLERATATGPHEVTLASGRRITAKYILIATGAHPHVPDFPGSDLGITSNEVFHLEKLPRRVLIAGGGYIANEFAGIFNEFGSHVTLVNRTDVILRGYDHSMRDRLLQISLMKGIDFRFHTEFKSIEKLESGALKVTLTKHEPIEVDCVLFATGRVPNTEGLGLADVGVELDEKGAVKVDADNKSSVDSIYAVGDVTNRVQLTPVAIREGQAFADTIFGNKPHQVDYGCIPSAVFSHPPMAGVGMTESEARNKLGSIAVYQSDFRAMKNVLADRNERALYKMICEGTTGRVVGLHMIGPDAPEILQAAAVAVKAGLTKDAFDQTVALHPTMSEELVLMK